MKFHLPLIMLLFATNSLASPNIVVSINTAKVDIMGLDIKPGADYYLKLIQDITHKAVQCLK
jgi:ABC-type Zn2+ transport system substrate-binding protein/surface adhesin